MAKRTKTAIKNIVSYPNGDLYYLRGDVEQSLGTKDLKIAEGRKLQFQSTLGFFGVEAYKLRVSHVWQRYLDLRYAELQGNGSGGKKIRQSTYDEIETIWKRHLKREFETMRLIEINEVRWNRFIKRLKIRDASNLRKVMLGFLGFCKQEGHLKVIPELKIPVVRRRPRRILTENEIKTLLSNSNRKLLLYNSMYLFMAMRNGEIVKMEWNRINFEENYLFLRERDVKTNKPRAMLLNPIVRSMLLETLKDQVDQGIKSPYVFPKRGNQKAHTIETGLRKSWETTLKRCGWEVGYITPHDLRATYETYSHKRADFTDTQREKFAGASISVQKRIYVDFKPDDLAGLETAVQVPGIEDIILSSWNRSGKLLGEKPQ